MHPRCRFFEPWRKTGDTRAQGNIGVMYAHGEGVPQDYAEAVKWFRRAAEQGDAHAQYNLAVQARA
jgi:uncharacterized protein